MEERAWNGPAGKLEAPPLIDPLRSQSHPMPPKPPNAELMQSLGRLVRGLSCLFWGLPAALVICFHAARGGNLESISAIGPSVCTGLLSFGLWQLGGFQRQERIWRKALDRASLFALINLGLSPFLYWSSKVPGNIFFSTMVAVMAANGLIFLASLNHVLQRLGAMLPDEALRVETRQFTLLNLNLLLAAVLLGASFMVLIRLPNLPLQVQLILNVLVDRGGFWFLVLLIPFILLPLAMTMALLWKTKEVILDNVFSSTLSGER